MTARSVRDIPMAGHWSYEPKADGFRALVFRDQTGRVRLQSRQQRSLTRYFPDVVAAIAEQLVGDVVLAGEIVVYHHGRLDFAALQRRLSGGGTRRGARRPPATSCSTSSTSPVGTCSAGPTGIAAPSSSISSAARPCPSRSSR
jgi:ATP-dependent DNA ligase